MEIDCIFIEFQSIKAIGGKFSINSQNEPKLICHCLWRIHKGLRRGMYASHFRLWFHGYISGRTRNEIGAVFMQIRVTISS